MADADTLRAEARTWVGDNWDPDLPLLAWRQKLVESGWAAPSWPERWHGRDLPGWADDIVRNEVISAGAVHTPVGVGMMLAAPTLLAEGSEAIGDRFLVPTIVGEVTWCQLFSEPGAGSDLAGLSCRADLDGDEWVVSGQKVWNTSAHHADYGLLVARTDHDAPKHHGITYFVLPMKQPGVEVRPIRQMNDHSSFNEVFLTEARIPVDNVIGDLNEGWRVARTTLAFERRFGAMGRPSYSTDTGRALDEARREAEEYFSTYRWYPQRAGRPDLVVERARAHGVERDPIIRQELMRTWILQQVSRWTAQRAQAARAAGRTPGPEGSIGKLAMSNVARQAAKTHSLIAGAQAMLTGPDSPADGVIAEVLTSVPAQSIAGGTDEIQHNIIGERALGLPREP